MSGSAACKSDSAVRAKCMRVQHPWHIADDNGMYGALDGAPQSKKGAGFRETVSAVETAPERWAQKS
eukprot:352800-Chlamydomonas_euryale.AAC.7